MAIGAAVGAMAGAGIYTYYNHGQDFNYKEFLLATGGAVVGGLIGTGVGIVIAPEVVAEMEAAAPEIEGAIEKAAPAAENAKQVINDLIANSNQVEKARERLVYQSPGGLSAPRKF